MKEENLSQRTKGKAMRECLDLEEGADLGLGRDSGQGPQCHDMMIYIERMIHLDGMHKLALNCINL